jgi:glycosyltransferase involved in cell wall biosynthesis
MAESFNPRILYIAPLEDTSGYARAARDYVAALDHVGCDLVTRSLNYDNTKQPLADRAKLLRNKALSNVDIVIQHTTPNEQSKPASSVFDCRYFAWETDKVPQEWVKSLNTADLIMVPCDDNVRACTIAGVLPPVVKIPHTFDINKYKELSTPFDMPGFEAHFKFLSICQIAKKKGIDALLMSYLSEFTSTDNVVLILKVYFGPNDGEGERQAFLGQIQAIKDALRLPGDKYPRIYVVHALNSDEAINRLYATSDCYILPSRGEGFSITHMDALGYGKPAIGLDIGGTREFLSNANGWLVPSDFSPCHSMPHPHSFMYTALDNWAEPKLLDIRRAMRQAFQEWNVAKTTGIGAWINRCNSARETVNNFSYGEIGHKMQSALYSYYAKWRKNRGS